MDGIITVLGLSMVSLPNSYLFLVHFSSASRAQLHWIFFENVRDEQYGVEEEELVAHEEIVLLLFLKVSFN